MFQLQIKDINDCITLVSEKNNDKDKSYYFDQQLFVVDKSCVTQNCLLHLYKSRI